MSRRWGPDPAFVSALAVFLRVQLSQAQPEKGGGKGRQRRLWSGLWHLLASLWLAFGGQLGHKDGIENQEKFDTKIHSENDRECDTGASKIPQTVLALWGSGVFKGW